MKHVLHNKCIHCLLAAFNANGRLKMTWTTTFTTVHQFEGSVWCIGKSATVAEPRVKIFQLGNTKMPHQKNFTCQSLHIAHKAENSEHLKSSVWMKQTSENQSQFSWQDIGVQNVSQSQMKAKEFWAIWNLMQKPFLFFWQVLNTNKLSEKCEKLDDGVPKWTIKLFAGKFQSTCGLSSLLP